MSNKQQELDNADRIAGYTGWLKIKYPTNISPNSGLILKILEAT